MEFQIVPISYRCSKDLLLWLIKSSSHIQSGMCIQSGTYELLISLRIINMHLPVPANLYSDLILNMLVIIVIIIIDGLPWWLSTKESSCNAAAAKLLQSCPILCNPIDKNPPGSPVPGILQARTLEWVAISFSNAWKWKVKEKSLSRVQLLVTPWTAANQAPPLMGFSRQQYWSGVPLPSPSCNAGEPNSIPGLIPWRKGWQSTPVFLPEESHGQRSLVGCSPWGH